MDGFFETRWIADMVSAGHRYTTISVIHHCHSQTIRCVGLKHNYLMLKLAYLFNYIFFHMITYNII